MPTNLAHYLKPTWGKLIIPIFFLIWPFGLNYVITIPYDIGYWLWFLTMCLCMPFYSVLSKLGMLQWTVGLTGPYQGPTIAGIFLAMLSYALLFYLIACLTVYVKEKYPASVLTKKW
ncbi:hypothetical protein KKB83_01915 [Patescibacteria group bacterium]|nr:hypothetical protein [Patescibacteria group bacterium]